MLVAVKVRPDEYGVRIDTGATADLDGDCARWPDKSVVGTEEYSRGGSNQRMGSSKDVRTDEVSPLTRNVPYKPYALIGPVRFCAGGA